MLEMNALAISIVLLGSVVWSRSPFHVRGFNMWLYKSTQTANLIIVRLSWILHVLGGLFLVLMMLVTSVDVIGRNLFNKPFTGATEYAEYFMLAVGLWGLAWGAIQGKHIMVTLLISRFPQKVQNIICSFHYFVLMVLSGLIAYQNIIEASSVQQLGSKSEVTKIPDFYFYYIVAIAFIALSLALLTLSLAALQKEVKK
jgi:TRAP-type C4-dicarboxylate transport system permease small subunit